MSQETKNRDLCPLAEAALLLDSKWDLVVIYNLLSGQLRFSQLKHKISDGIETPITSSSLTRILRKLESEDLVQRDLSEDITYQLTAKGLALKDTIVSLKKWGNDYL